MQGLFRRAAASIVALVLLAPQSGGVTLASSPHRTQPKVTVALATPPQRIPVKEPARVKPTPLPASVMHPTILKGVRAHGTHVDGPPMLRPLELDRAIAAARRRTMEQAPDRTTAPPGRAIPPPTAAGTRPGPRRAMSLPSDPTASGTGINHWWRYQEENVPGGGHLMVNVGTGNLVLQDDDMAVPHKGIAMAFRRTYNSQSLHDVNADDGAGMIAAVPGMYGNGWTNTFDAHINRTADGTKWFVYDIDGARYDYAHVPGSLTWTPPPGQYATLASDGNCGMIWTKKTGTAYYFYVPNPAASCPALAPVGGYTGRLYQIVGRNRNTYITFSYSWDNGNASTTGKISAITATTESGMTTTLSFADFNGHRLLQQLTLPDGTNFVSYGYDALGNLTWVAHPPNNTAGTRPQQAYGYGTIGSNSILALAASPRWNMLGDGGYVSFSFNGTSATSSTLAAIGHVGVMNWTPNDGTNTVLQPGVATGAVQFLTEYFTTGVTTPTYRDTDGHMTNWVVDGTGRPTQTQECTASASQGQQCTGTWLTTNEGWDANNNLTSETSARGYETDFAYDANGNEIAVAQPSTTTSQGTFRPTSLYDYDAYNNVTAFCDQTETHAAGADWTGPPAASDSLCSSRGVPHAQFAFAYPSYQPYGQLATMTTPLGYNRRIGYAPGQQGGTDFGLPTSVTGDPIAQLDGTSITPAQTFWYDGPGNLRCYSKGVGTYVLSYDALGRLTSEADPDDTSANAGSLCGKTSGQAGWNTQATYAYFPDGAKSGEQTPAERAFGVSSTYTYDLDGDIATAVQHHGCVAGSSCTAGTTTKWYDGADRLIEVQQPTDSSALTWALRYLYDMTAGGTVTMTAAPAPFAAYGNLFKTQTLLGTQWTDQKGNAFDALDRSVQSFSYQLAESPGTNPTIETTRQTYDGSSPATLGLLTQKTNPSGESVTYTYDELSRIHSQTYAGDNGVTPSETYVYDANGRKASITSGTFGAQQYAYDADGRLQRSIEPSGGALTDAAQLTYSYYGNGKESAVSVASPNFTQANLIAYSYRPDGDVQTQTANAFGGGTWNKSYTDAGRLLSVGGITTQHLSYDATGQLTSEALASGTLSFTHDAEGSVVTTNVPNIFPMSGGWPVTETLTTSLNVRGEISGETWTPNNGLLPSETGTSAAGYYSLTPVPGPDAPQPSCDDSIDYINGVHIARTCTGTGATGGAPPGDSWSFDPTGRLTKHVNVADSSTTYTTAPPRSLTYTINTTTTNTTTNTYNAENRPLSTHTVMSKLTTNTSTNVTTGSNQDFGATTVGWGPNDHPALLQFASYGKTPSVTLHWDGDMVLFVTDASGNVVDFNVGLDGEAVPGDMGFTGMNSYDRDPSGTLIAINNSTGTSGMQPKDPTLAAAASTAQAPGFKGPGNPYVQYVRSDGFQLVAPGASTITINGVRAYDSSLGAWTTPDAYQGDVHDPASQQHYMFNRGNAYDYSDPSGYFSEGFEQFAELIAFARRGGHPKPPHHGGEGPKPRVRHPWPDKLGEQHLPDLYEPPRGGPRKNSKGDWVDARGNTWHAPLPGKERHGEPHWDVNGKDWERRHPEKKGHNVPIRPPDSGAQRQ
jgi:YD repeat-containing protein